MTVLLAFAGKRVGVLAGVFVGRTMSWVVWTVTVAVSGLIGFTGTHFSVRTLRYVTAGTDDRGAPDRGAGHGIAPRRVGHGPGAGGGGTVAIVVERADGGSTFILRALVGASAAGRHFGNCVPTSEPR
jgi:hypothetical protein